MGRMQGSLNKMAPASRQWRQAADFARELAHLVDALQGWLARSLCSTTLPFQKVCCALSLGAALHTFASYIQRQRMSGKASVLFPCGLSMCLPWPGAWQYQVVKYHLKKAATLLQCSRAGF